MFPEVEKGQHRNCCTVGDGGFAERRPRVWGDFPFLERFKKEQEFGDRGRSRGMAGTEAGAGSEKFSDWTTIERWSHSSQ